MLKVYVAAIVANHSLVASQSVHRKDLVVKFLMGALRLNLPHPYTVSTWDLSIVLRTQWAVPLSHSSRTTCSACRLRLPSIWL